MSDTFAELRSDREHVERELVSKCFICDFECNISHFLFLFSAQRFDREASGFYHHSTYEHNIWEYVCYYIHIMEKAKVELCITEVR